MSEERAHAKLSPSASKRWLTCMPSGNLERHFPDIDLESKDSAASVEGTHAHAVAEAMLLYPGIEEAVRPYVDYVRKAAEGNTREVEVRLDCSRWIPECFGSSDSVVYDKTSLEIIDLKYGSHPVKAEKNTQLIIYALGALDKYDPMDEIKDVTMTIVQPRIARKNKASSWTISADLLRKIGEKIKEYACLAYEGDGKFVSGDHCFFCPAKQECNAYYMSYNKEIEEL